MISGHNSEGCLLARGQIIKHRSLFLELMMEVAKDYTIMLPSPEGIQQKMAAVKEFFYELKCRRTFVLSLKQELTLLICKNVCCFTSCFTSLEIYIEYLKHSLYYCKY